MKTLQEIYAEHPLREETILARLMRQRGSLEDVTELDLAHDSATEITDQNHVGGVAAVVQLACAAGVDAESLVLDVGSGLGGSARVLAHFFGCRVQGIELSPLRCEQSRRLSRRVGLDRLVTCTCGDILDVAVPEGLFDVVWGQGAWMHISNTAGLVARVAAALAPEGRVAFEEAMLLRSPATPDESRLLDELESLWGGRFLTLDAWRRALAGQALAIRDQWDLTPLFVEHLSQLDAIARSRGAGHYPDHEARAFTHGIALARAGVLVYTRTIAAPPGHGLASA